MSKYVRVMDGLKSNAGGFNYKVDEINVANKMSKTFFTTDSAFNLYISLNDYCSTKVHFHASILKRTGEFICQ